MTDYITVVAVDNGADHVDPLRHLAHDRETSEANDHSQFITVLSINDTAAKSSPKAPSNALAGEFAANTEAVIVYRLPGERLGFGLKFQGGTRSAEKIQKLFIQSCAPDSPASRATTSWGHLRESDEIVEIDGTRVTEMTRLECVCCLKESNLAIRLLVRNGEGKSSYMDNSLTEESLNGGASDKQHTPGGVPPKPPPVPPRKITKRRAITSAAAKSKATTNAKSGAEIVKMPVPTAVISEKPFTPPPDSEFYINLFSGNIYNGICMFLLS